MERLFLFALSISVGLLNLLIGLAVASRLGVIPKKASERVNRLTNRGTDFVIRIMEPMSPAAPKRKAKLPR